jgi:hypothetical protein
MEVNRTPFKRDAEPDCVQEVGHTALAEGVVRGIVGDLGCRLPLWLVMILWGHQTSTRQVLKPQTRTADKISLTRTPLRKERTRRAFPKIVASGEVGRASAYAHPVYARIRPSSARCRFSPTLTPPTNPHSARPTVSAPSPAISRLGAFRNPAARARGWSRHSGSENLHRRRH